MGAQNRAGRDGLTIGDRLAGVVQDTYNRLLRPRLPRRFGVFNGITARGDRLLDATDTHPEYEAGIVRSLRELVEFGDSVVVVGGGIGVSSVVAANQAGDDGTVTTYEASATHANEIVPETVRLNEPPADIDVKHAVVGEAVSTRGAHTHADVVSPEALPSCDVLELDCEGAETGILRGMHVRPRVVIVESHGHLGSPTHSVREDLVELGYEIVREQPEVEAKDMMVLTAVHSSTNCSPDLQL